MVLSQSSFLDLRDGGIRWDESIPINDSITSPFNQ